MRGSFATHPPPNSWPAYSEPICKLFVFDFQNNLCAFEELSKPFSILSTIRPSRVALQRVD
jgi:hypothetical protein